MLLIQSSFQLSGINWDPLSRFAIEVLRLSDELQ